MKVCERGRRAREKALLLSNFKYKTLYSRTLLPISLKVAAIYASIKQYITRFGFFFQYDLRALLFQLSPCIIRHSRGRHKVVKKKSRGNGYQLYKYTCANTSDSCSSKDKPFGRSRTQVTKFGKKTKTEASRKMSSASC